MHKFLPTCLQKQTQKDIGVLSVITYKEVKFTAFKKKKKRVKFTMQLKNAKADSKAN